jgi:hypothetical protein
VAVGEQLTGRRQRGKDVALEVARAVVTVPRVKGFSTKRSTPSSLPISSTPNCEGIGTAVTVAALP